MGGCHGSQLLSVKAAAAEDAATQTAAELQLRLLFSRLRWLCKGWTCSCHRKIDRFPQQCEQEGKRNQEHMLPAMY